MVDSPPYRFVTVFGHVASRRIKRLKREKFEPLFRVFEYFGSRWKTTKVYQGSIIVRKTIVREIWNRLSITVYSPCRCSGSAGIRIILVVFGFWQCFFYDQSVEIRSKTRLANKNQRDISDGKRSRRMTRSMKIQN